jgi:two-component system cell cycle response regulator DivK
MSVDRSRRILVVDDDALNLELLLTVLEGAGFEVHGACDARSGVDLARRLLPDVVLMDLQLPEMDGLDATRALHAEPSMASIPVIAVTAHVKKDDEERSLAAGCVRHVSKPIDTRALPALIREVLESPAPPAAPERLERGSR